MVDIKRASFVICQFSIKSYDSNTYIYKDLLYPRHLCRGVYSFRLSVRMFVRSFVRSYFLPSRGICVKVLR